MQNLRLAVRRIIKNPLVSIVAILSLALGIGANAAIFSLFNEMLLRPLPVPAPVELVNLANPGPKPGSQSCGSAGGCDEVFSYPMFRDLETQQTVFTGIAAHVSFGANIGHENETRDGSGLLVSGSYFSVLELQPAIGRLLNQSDDPAVGEAAVVVLSHDYWTNRFDSDTGIVGDTLVINGQPMTVVGVAPEGFDGTTLTQRPHVYVPITMRAAILPGFNAFENRRSYWVYLFARLKPGQTMEGASAAIGGQYRNIVNEVEAPLQTGMSDATMQQFREKALVLSDGRRGQSQVDEDAGPPITLLFLVTVGVLLIACANVANLLLARSAARSTEMAVRLSIGANRRTLIAQLLTESVVLAVVGGLAGLLFAQWTLQGIIAMMPPEAAETIRFQLDGTALTFAAIITLTTGFLFGLFPALHASRPNLLQTIKGTTGQPSGSRAASAFRTSLATFQIFVSMLLLGISGLFVQSLANISRVDLGIDVDNVITFALSPQRNGYSLEQTRQLYDRVEEELRAQPGVTSVTVALVGVLGGSSWGSNVSVEGFDAGPDTDTNSRMNEIGPGFFETIGVPLLRGRDFRDSDRLETPGVIIVNEAFARKFNLGADAVGKRMEIGNSGELDLEIIGLARDAKYNDVKSEAPPVFYLPYKQTERVAGMTFYVRTALDPVSALGTVQPLVSRIDPDLPVENLRTMPEQIRQNVFQDRIISVLAAAFAIVATLLAAVGLYGVLAYTVSQRTREFGLRMALGAEPGNVRKIVMKRVAWMTAVGAFLGVGGAVLAGRSIQSVLFELDAGDPFVLSVATITLVSIALLAGFIPALRASRVDPMTALRYE